MDPQELVPLEAAIPRPYNRQTSLRTKTCCKGPIRLCRLLAFMIILPSLFIFIPLYMRYRVFSSQMYPMSMTDMRLIDSKISPTWCQRQVVKSNATFNAFVVPGPPELMQELVPVTMTRRLELEDDMKEYWGFYLLQGSTVTVSACVRWPGASLIMIKGYKHLQECAYIGDDSSEELDELLEAHKLGLLTNATLIQKIQELKKVDGKANHPDIDGNISEQVTNKTELDLSKNNNNHTFNNEDKLQNETNVDETVITTNNTVETKENYIGYKQNMTINKPGSSDPVNENTEAGSPTDNIYSNKHKDKTLDGAKEFGINNNDKDGVPDVESRKEVSLNSREVFDDVLKQLQSLGDRGKRVLLRLQERIGLQEMEQIKGDIDDSTNNGNVMGDGDAELDHLRKVLVEAIDEERTRSQRQQKRRTAREEARAKRELMLGHADFVKELNQDDEARDFAAEEMDRDRRDEQVLAWLMEEDLEDIEDPSFRADDIESDRDSEHSHHSTNTEQSSSEVEGEVSSISLGYQLCYVGKDGCTKWTYNPLRSNVRTRAHNIVEKQPGVKPVAKNANTIMGLSPDGFAEHHQQLNQSTPFDMSNSEFWSSFSSSEEALLECEGLILNLPLTPHASCRDDATDDETMFAARRNALTYR
ncbi:unnamed protein product [Leptidea sinapis]|uniref:E3 ubiquitin-protein ligase APD1-4 N-terminal domain-containing protein n=1 Tax=Leptidea sinapis TaxID=189913 RepID=A0A5E4QET3_9NEOP|nr:unnamed protein product [Leptidea sinapis]